MILLRSVFFLFVAFIFPSLVSLGLGILLSKTERFHMLGIRLIAMSMLVPGRFISSRCHQSCISSEKKCGIWNCDMFSRCGFRK